MVYFLTLINIGLLVYFLLYKPTFAIVYLFVFFIITDILLSKVNIQGYRLLLRYISIFLLLIANAKLKLWQNNFRFYFKNKILWGFFLLYFIILIHTFLFKNQYQNIKTDFTFNFTIYCFIPFFITLLILDNKKKLNLAPTAIVSIGLFYFLVFYLFIDYNQIEIGDRTTFERIGFNSIATSRIGGLIFISSYLLLLKKQKTYFKYTLGIAITLSGFLVLVSSQRGTIIGILFALALFSFFNSNKKHRYIFYVASLMLVSIFLLNIINIEKFGILDRFYELKEYESFQRYSDYFVSWNLFKNNFAFGVGPNGYFITTGRVYPHNIILELISEYGIFGLISCLLILVPGLNYTIKLIKNKQTDYEIKILASLWNLMLISVLVSGNIISNSIFWVLTAILIVSARELSLINKYYYL